MDKTIFELINEISTLLNNNQIDISNLTNDIKAKLNLLPDNERMKVEKYLDNVQEIVNYYIENDFDILSSEDENEINDLMLEVIKIISNHSEASICNEDINNLFQQSADDLIEIPKINIIKIQKGSNIYNKDTKKCNVIFESTFTNSFKLYGNNNNKYIINNVFTIKRDQIMNVFSSEFLENQFEYINNLQERDKILLYTYTTTIGILIIKKYKMHLENKNVQLNLMKYLQVNTTTKQIPLFYIFIDYLESRDVELDYSDLHKCLLEKINTFDQNDFITIIETYINNINEIVNNAPKINNVILYRGLKDKNHIVSNEVFFNSFSILPYVAWTFVDEKPPYDNTQYSCMIKANVKSEIPVLFISMISSEIEQFEIVLSNKVQYTNKQEKTQSCIFRINSFNNNIYRCIKLNQDCDQPINIIKNYFDDMKYYICQKKNAKLM